MTDEPQYDRSVAEFTDAEWDVLMTATHKIGKDMSATEAALFVRYYDGLYARTGWNPHRVMAAGQRRRLARLTGGAS